MTNEKIKLCLINLPIREDVLANWIPHGLGYLAYFVEQKGFKCDILDYNARREAYNNILEEIKDYDVIGFSCMITQYVALKNLVSQIKSTYPDKFIIVGGNITTGIEEELLKLSIDAIFIGEGEITFPKILENINDYKGKIIHGEPLTDLNLLPEPQFDRFPLYIYLYNNIMQGFNFKKSLNFMGTRGCPYRCNFCFDGRVSKVRGRNAKNLVNDIVNAKNKYGIDYFTFDDELFIYDRNRVFEFCKLIKPHNLKWSATIRANIFTYELGKTMFDAGCISGSFGAESVSDNLLVEMNKLQKVEDIVRTIVEGRKIGMIIGCSFIVGSPSESVSTIRETIDFCKKYHLNPAHLFYMTPTPNTAFWKYCLEKNLVPDLHAYLEKISSIGDFSNEILINMTSMSDEQLRYNKEEAEKEIHNNYKKYVLSHPLEAFRTLRKMGIKKLVRAIKNA